MESEEYDFRAEDDETPAKPANPVPGHLLLWPLLLMALALVTWFSFQLSQTLKTRDGLAQALANQEAQVQNSNKIKQSLAALAVGTKQLAAQGNANAAQIITALAKRGIKVADPQPAQPAQAPQK